MKSTRAASRQRRAPPAAAATAPPKPPAGPSAAAMAAVLLLLLGSIIVPYALFAVAHEPSFAHALPPSLANAALLAANGVRTNLLALPAVPATPLWHRARRLMATSFAPVRAFAPDTRISHVWMEPLVTFFDGYLTEAEIGLLIAQAEPHFKKSMVVKPDGSVAEDSARTSDTAWIYPNTDAEVDRLVEKLSHLAGFSPHNAEAIAVNRYRSSQYFAPHHDYLEEEHLRNTKGDFRMCQRTATVLVYLSNVESGGETMFVRNGTMDKDFKYEPDNPDHLAVTPRKGRVLVWFDMHPHTEDIDKRTLHGGAPVKEGVKIAATLFLRNCSSDVYKPKPEVDAAESKQDL